MQTDRVSPDQAFDRWSVQMKSRSLADRTVRERVRFVRALARTLGCTPLEFKALELERYLANDDFMPTTRFNYHVIMRTWSRWLVDAGLRPDDPTVGLGTPRLPRRVPRPAHSGHIDALMLHGNCQLKTIVKILLASRQGLRVHEIAKVRGEHIDLTAGRLYIVGKGGVTDDAELDPFIAAIAPLFPERGWWFPSPVHEGRPVRYDSVSRVLSQAFRRVGAPVTAHQLRHWLATELIAAGVPTRVVQQIMRHSSIKTTEGYAAVRAESRRDALRRLPAPALDRHEGMHA